MGTVGKVKGTGVGATTTPETPKLPDAIDLSSYSPSEQKQIIATLQATMGQTGNEAGDSNASPGDKLYANTGKSMNINAYLNSDGDTIYAPNSNWNGLVSESWVKNAILKLDLGMKPLTANVKVARFLDADALGKMLPNAGIDTSNFSKLVDMLESGKIAKKDFAAALQGANYTHKAYTSGTYTQKHGSYDTRDVKLNMVLTKGTKAIVTNNHKEGEIVAGRNQKYTFTGGYHVETTSTGKKQLVLDVYI